MIRIELLQDPDVEPGHQWLAVRPYRSVPRLHSWIGIEDKS
jgi:hypothetical protein